jgi:hypothetical protein
MGYRVLAECGGVRGYVCAGRGGRVGDACVQGRWRRVLLAVVEQAARRASQRHCTVQAPDRRTQGIHPPDLTAHNPREHQGKPPDLTPHNPT